jgi:hypothetical protein
MKQLITLLVAFSLMISVTWAQAGPRKFVLLTGVVTKLDMRDSSETPVNNVPVEIWANGELLATITTASKGRYQYRLPFYNTYMIKFGAWPYVTKMVEIDASDFTKEAQTRGFEMNIDIVLFEDRGNKQLDFLKETPVAKAAYSKRNRTVIWDIDHTESVNQRMRTAMSARRK